METEYNPVRRYLEKELEDKEVFLWDEEIETIILLANRMKSYHANKGIFSNRLEHNPREKAFSEQWLKENLPSTGINNGCGILQDLFIENIGLSQLSGKQMIEEIQNRDRMIVATVIQWLGSNCGMAFINESLQRFDATVVYNQKQCGTIIE